MQFKQKLIAASLASLVTFAVPSLAHATALAQSQVSITGFSILTGAGTPVDPVALQAQAANSGQIAATLTGAVPFSIPGGPGSFSLSNAIGPDAGTYNPTAQLVAPNGQYSGSTSIIAGNALLPGGADAYLDNTVSLLNPALGTAQSNASVNASFTLTLATPTQFQFLFDADPYLIAQLTQPGILARAGYNMTIVVADGDGNEVINWTPNGIDGDAVGGVDIDPFSLNRTVQALNAETSLLDDGLGSFSFISDVLAPGDYTFQILNQSAVSAQFAAEVPEPASAALLGVALLGLGLSRRQRKSSK